MDPLTHMQPVQITNRRDVIRLCSCSNYTNWQLIRANDIYY
jgi:hypothetical protein